MIVLETTKGDSPTVESQLHKACENDRITGELFTLSAIPIFLAFADITCLKSCRSTDMQERSRRLERKRYALMDKENRKANSLIHKLKQKLESSKDKLLNIKRHKRARALKVSRDHEDHLSTWLDENLVSKVGVKVHVHRFDKAYRASKGLPAPAKKSTSSSIFISRLTDLGFIVSGGGDKKRDSSCCKSTGRYVTGADIRNSYFKINKLKT